MSLSDIKYALKEGVFRQPAVMGLYLALALPVIHGLRHLGLLLPAASMTCRNLRQLTSTAPSADGLTMRRYRRLLEQTIRLCHSNGRPVPLEHNPLHRQFKGSKGAARVRDYFASLDRRHTVSMKLPRRDDYPERQGDLIVLKKAVPATGEKGVLLLKYNNAFTQFIALYDVNAVARHYRLILEPSWWGYCDVMYLLFIGADIDVLVECPHPLDFDFIKGLGRPFTPLALGAGDWVDHRQFASDEPAARKYDVIYVANWGRHKRHAVLFSALEKVLPRLSSLKVALIGYPSGGRTINDVKREAHEHGLLPHCDFFESIPHREVARLLQTSKVCVLVSKAEGANKSVYEALFSGVPIVVYEEKANLGSCASFADQLLRRGHLNEQTGKLASEDNLAEVLEEVIINYAKYDPRAWALAHTGYHNATRLLNEKLKELALAAGEPWTTDIVPKKNGPNLLYVNEADRLALEPEYKKLEAYLDPNP